MGKRIVSQARGHGSLTYRVRKKAYIYRVGYPSADAQGKAKIIKLFHSAAHSSPLIKIQTQDGKKNIFYNLAFQNAYEGQEITIGKIEDREEKDEKIKEGDIIKLKDAKIGMLVYNIEAEPGGGGKFIRTAGSSAQVVRKEKNKISLLMPSKKVMEFNERCRATIGIAAASGRLDKPFMKAGKKFHLMKARGRKWHFTSKVKVNVVDHPFGSGRGKRIKSKIAKRNAPPGAKVGHIRPRQTGRKK